MNKTIISVFKVLGVLVVIFLAWQLIFNDGGLLKVGVNNVIEGINGQWAKVAGEGKELLPKWGDNADSNGEGFSIDTKGNGSGN